MAIEDLPALLGRWELTVDLPGAEDVRCHGTVDMMGEVLLQRTSLPVPQASDSCCVVVCQEGRLGQHYFDSRGVARLYEMTFDGHTWILERGSPDSTPLDFHQRFNRTLSEARTTITAEWRSSSNGHDWSRDFGLTYRRTADRPNAADS